MKKMLEQRTAESKHFNQKMYVVPFGADYGDSGAPVWTGSGAAVGLIEGFPKANSHLTYVTPLLDMPHTSVLHAPGALKAPGMYDLHVITDG